MPRSRPIPLPPAASPSRPRAGRRCEPTAELPPLVARVRAKILRELARGHHAVSEPVPPQREWARRLGVSSFTVQRAFEALKREGIVEAREGSYTFLRRLPEGIPAEHELSGPRPKTRISLWFSEPKDLRWMRKSLLRQRFARKFLAEHPDARIDEHLFDVSPGLLEARILSNMLKGPDPMACHARRTCLAQLAEHEVLAPIIEPPETEPYLEKVNPRWLQVCTLKKALRVLPTSVSCSFLFYNKELFRKAGLDPAQPPRDWEGFLAAARTLSASLGGQPSFHLINHMHLVWWLMQLTCEAMPLHELDACPGSTPSLPRVDWLGGAARRALEFFIQLHSREKILRVCSEDLLPIFSRCLKDQVPMMMGDTRLAALAVQLNQAHRFGIAPMPAGPNGQTISMLNCVGWILNAHARPEEQEAATRYVLARERFIHQGSGGAEMKALGILPPMLSVLSDSSADTFATGPLPPDWKAVLEHLSATGRWEPEDADWKKEILASAVPACLEADPVPDPQHLQHNLALAEAGDGGDEPHTSTLP